MRSTRAGYAVLPLLLVAACSSQEADPEPTRSNAATPIMELAEGVAVPPGRYAVPFVGLDQDAVEAEVEVPEGFEKYNGSFLWNGNHDVSYALSFWRISGVNPDPCHADPPKYLDPGPSVRDLAMALRRQPHRQGPDAIPAQLAGYEGLYLELTLPKRLNPERCANGSYEAWQAVHPEHQQTYDRYQYGPGWVDQIWILDVDGHALVINATHDPRITASDTAVLGTMLKSITIHTGETGRS